MRIAKTLTYMDIVQFPDGYAHKTVVMVEDGRHFVISEVHRDRIDEVLVFPCTAEGEVTDWTEVYGKHQSSTPEVLARFDDWRLDDVS